MRLPSEVEPFDAISRDIAHQRLRDAREDRRDMAIAGVALLLVVAGVFAAFAVVVF